MRIQKITTRISRCAAFLVSAALVVSAALLLTGCTVGIDPSATASAFTEGAADDSPAGADASTTSATISGTSSAATAFLATLSDAQRATVLYDYHDETKTTSWSNSPINVVTRAGLNLNDLTDVQKAAALQVLDALLNAHAYDVVTGIMSDDQYLLDYSSASEASLGQYYIAFFGDPGQSSAYTLQFGGHHLGINATLDASADAITFAPTQLGVQPAVYSDEDGNAVQPFAAIVADAFAFFDSLTQDQQAVLTAGDIRMCVPGDLCDFPTGAGLAAADLTADQQRLLRKLLSNWVGMADAQTTATAMAKIDATLDATVIAWSGATADDPSTGEGFSFSVSGPNVYVALQSQHGSAGADIAGVSTSGWGHLHSIYRDPSNDYAGSVIQQAPTTGNGADCGSENPDGRG